MKYLKTIVIACLASIAISLNAKNSISVKNSKLDALAIKYGTDKGSRFEHIKENIKNPHDYANTYSFYFNGIKNNSLRFLEIGIWHGDSARMWHEYFPNAQLHFMDINEQIIEKIKGELSDRCSFHLADQGNAQDLETFIANIDGEFNIILDDGGHTMHQQITSFMHLFPILASGGIYVIEDLHTSYWHEFGGSGTRENPQAYEGTTVAFLQQLIHDVNYIGARTGCAAAKYCPQEIFQDLTYYQQTIKSIHFYDSLCFIFKR